MSTSAGKITHVVTEALVVLVTIATVVVAGYSWRASQQANEIAVEALKAQHTSSERALADKVLVATRRIKKPGHNVVEVRVQNYGVQRIGIPQFERRDPPAGKTRTAILTSELEACQEAVFTVSGTWWRALYHPYLVFKDGKGHIWKLHEASEAVLLPRKGNPDRRLPFDEDTFSLAEKAGKIRTVRDRDALRADRVRTLRPCG